MKQRILTIIALLLCLSLLAGCDAADGSGKGWVNTSQNSGVFCDVGYYYLSNNNCLCFLDVANGINVVLCSRIGCPHDNSQLDADGEKIYCEAYILGELQCYWDGNIYYTTQDDYGVYLYRRNADGTAQERVMQLCKDYVTPEQSMNLTDFHFVDGTVYYRMNISSIKIEQTAEGPHTIYDVQHKLFMRLDLRTEKEELIQTQDLNTSPYFVALSTDGLICSTRLIDPAYYELEYDDPRRDEYYADSTLRVTRLDIATGEETVLIEKHFSEGLGVEGMSGNTLLYNIIEDGQKVLRSLNLRTGKDKRLHEREIVYINDDYGFTYEGEDEKLTLMNMKTGELLPTAYQDIFMYPGDIGESGMILIRKVQTEGSSRSKRIYAYVSFADIVDGLQEEDLVDFFIK